MSSILHLHNGLLRAGAARCPSLPRARTDPCNSGAMSAATNQSALSRPDRPARCHQDDVLKTSVAARRPAPFEYRFRIPDNEPPGLYWYHPHIHGFSCPQVLGGASGALIIEGIERAVPTRRTAGARAGDPRSGPAESERAAFEVRARGAEDVIDREATPPTTAPDSAGRPRTCRSTSCPCPSPIIRRPASDAPGRAGAVARAQRLGHHLPESRS